MKRPRVSSSDAVRSAVRRAYGSVATTKASCGCASQSCCGTGKPRDIAKAVGYAGSDLSDLPEGANMGLSCGNPTALASLKSGETVLDLGSGGGFDCFIAATRVGKRGRVIGVDMTPEMIEKARGNIPSFRKKTRLDNVEFRLGEIEHLPVADASVDVVISNCVINLSPDKPQVWREIARVLRPGGRVAISDLATLKRLPPAVKKSMAALAGCVAGAVPVEDIREMARRAGLTRVATETHADFAAAVFGTYDTPRTRREFGVPPGLKLTDYVTSVHVTAVRNR